MTDSKVTFKALSNTLKQSMPLVTKVKSSSAQYEQASGKSLRSTDDETQGDSNQDRNPTIPVTQQELIEKLYSDYWSL